jgi:hypothetical protein
MSDSVFGELVVDTEIGDQVQATLALWFPTYLGLLNRQLVAAGINIGDLPAPGSYVHTSNANHFPEEAPPAVVIAIPGTMGEPVRDGCNNYRAFWDVRVTVFVTAPSRDLTERLAKYYGTAVRLMMEQKPSLGNFAEGTTWKGTSYSVKVADRDERTLGSCENRFRVDVRDVVQAFAGPQAPIEDVPASWPEVTSTKVTLTPQPLQ